LTVIDPIELDDKFVTPNPLSIEGYTDLDNIMFAKVFITSNADALVTGNLRHYKPLLKKRNGAYSSSVYGKVFSQTGMIRELSNEAKINQPVLIEKD